jgi:hypothetical protein
MTTAVAVANTGSAVAVAGNYNPFEAYAEAANTSRIVGDLLKFSKGDYTAGQNGDEVAIGTQVAANMGEFYVGWVKWVDGKPAEQMMGKIGDGYVPARRSELGDHDKDLWEVDDNGQQRDPWQVTNYLVMMDPKSGKLYTFTASSKGGLGALGKLAGLYGKNMRSMPDKYPLVALNVDKYKHPNKAFGIIKTPKLDVVGWVDKGIFEAAMAAAAADSSEDETAPFKEAPAPKGKGAKVAVVNESMDTEF